jgi:hypothetical protein
MANRPDALQSSRRSQCFGASIWTTWLYRPDAIQCSTRIRVSASRHSYEKTAAIVQTMCDPVRTMSSINQERAYHPDCTSSTFIYVNCEHQFNRPDVSLQGPDAPSLIMVIPCSRSVTVRTLGQHRPDARSSRPDTFRYFGHNVLLKYWIGTKSGSLESLEKMM